MSNISIKEWMTIPAGVISGVIVAYAVGDVDDVINSSGPVPIFFPGFIFYLFSLLFFWRSFIPPEDNWKFGTWAAFCVASFLVGVIVSTAFFSPYLVGVVGTAIILIGYRLCFGSIPRTWLLSIFAVGSLANLFILLSDDLFNISVTSLSFSVLLTVTTWQTFMLFSFVHLERIRHRG